MIDDVNVVQLEQPQPWHVYWVKQYCVKRRMVHGVLRGEVMSIVVSDMTANIFSSYHVYS